MSATDFTAPFDWRSWAVFLRNGLVYLRNWKTAFFPPAMEPIVFFVAFGLGLQGFIGELDYRGTSISYASYVAPGLLAYTAFSTPFFEALYSSFVRMVYQKTWDGILATQVEVQHIVWGEVYWASARGFMNQLVVSFVLLGFWGLGLVELRVEWLFLLPFIGFVAGWMFSAFALIFTAIVPSIDHMNYPAFLVGIPLGLFSNTYFPVPESHPALLWLIRLNPIAQLSETYRGLLLLGDPGPHLLWLLGLTVAWLIPMAWLAERLTRRRVLGG